MSFRFAITTGSTTPIYKQLTDQVRLAIANGQLKPGDKLPSVRAVAETLVLNPNTVARSYGDLVKENILESRHGKGVFVRPQRQILMKPERVRRLEPHLSNFLNEARMLGFSEKEVQEMITKGINQWGTTDSTGKKG